MTKDWEVIKQFYGASDQTVSLNLLKSEWEWIALHVGGISDGLFYLAGDVSIYHYSPNYNMMQLSSIQIQPGSSYHIAINITGDATHWTKAQYINRWNTPSSFHGGIIIGKRF